jgi:hypothetical protein
VTAEGKESIVFEAQVSVHDGRPFVKMTCSLASGDPVFATQLRPAVVTALGLRAIQAAIEAERDAGLVAFYRDIEAPEEAIGSMLLGMRHHREQFDAAEGSMRRLGPDDRSEAGA